MGRINAFTPVRLIMGVLTTRDEAREALLSLLTERYGPVKEESAHIPFSYTDYYDREMGGKPTRYFLVFRSLIDPARLASIKIETNDIEGLFVEGEGRKVNLDPGILSAGSLILATTKNRSHRVPLERGIYAETTLIFYDHRFNALPWTYADYGSDAFRLLFREYRDDYLRQLREERA